MRVDLSAGSSFGEEEGLGANGQQSTNGFGSPAAAQARLQAIGDALGDCQGASYDVHAVTIQGGTVTVAAGTGSDAEVVWLVRDGRRISYVVIPAGDPVPPDSVTERVGDLVLSDRRVGSTSVGDSAPQETTQNVPPVH